MIFTYVVPVPDERIKCICDDYWSFDGKIFLNGVKSIQQKYGISSKELTGLVQTQGAVVAEGLGCSICKNGRIFLSRQSYLDALRFSSNTPCAQCMARKRQDDAERIKREQEDILNRIKSLYPDLRPKVSVVGLDFEDLLHLTALIRHSATETLDYAMSLESSEMPLAPLPEHQRDISMSLYRKGIINISPRSPAEAFVAPDFDRFFHNKVYWLLPADEMYASNSDMVQAIEEQLVLLSREISAEVRKEVWRRIAIGECIQYLEHSLKEHGLDFSSGDKTKAVISSVLMKYSVAQVYSFIWRAARDAAAFKLREGVPGKHAANTAIGSIQRLAERAQSDGWDVKGYGRRAECPRSAISYAFFDLALGIGEQGFTVVPE